ncbi:MAG: ABC transporter permease [Clostridiales bacterium]|nr:ABC transporter permease [Clostridiales bacterium]
MKEKEMKNAGNPSFVEQFKQSDTGGLILILAAFLIIVAVVSGPKFFQVTNLLNLMRSVAVTGIMACAITLVMVTGNIDLSLGWLIGLCSCITAVYSKSTLLAILLPILIGAIGGAVNGILVGGLKLNAFIATLGTMYAYKGAAMLYANNRLLTAADNPSLKFVGQGYFLKIPVPVWIFAVFAAICWFILKKTVFGTQIYAVGSNRVSAKFTGISSAKVIISSYIIGGIATGLAGVIFFTQVMSTQAYSGAGLEFDVLTAVVLGGTSVTGGKGSIFGTLLGAIFVAILSNGFTMMGIPATLQYIAQGIILIAAIRADIVKARRLK